MTPEETKARELVEKYWYKIKSNSSTITNDRDIHNLAKQCALIHVNGIIKELLDIERREHYTYERREYWNEVKNQIQLL